MNHQIAFLYVWRAVDHRFSGHIHDEIPWPAYEDWINSLDVAGQGASTSASEVL